MQFKRLTVQNFMGIGFGVLAFNSGLHLITGHNLDMPDEGESNGASKSTLFEAIGWALYDYVNREDFKADDAVNSVVGKDCLVHVTLEHEGQEIKVRRTRAHTRYGNSWDLWIDGDKRTQHTLRDTKEAIKQVLPVSERIFKYGVLVGQGMPNRFLSLSERGKMELLCDVVDLRIYERAAKGIDTQLKELLTELTGLEASLSQAQYGVQVAEQRVEAANQELQSYEVTVKDNVEVCTQRTEELQQSLKAAQEQLETIAAEATQRRHALQLVDQSLDQQMQQSAGIASQAAMHRHVVERGSAEMQSLQNLSGATCPTCRQDVSSEHIVNCMLTLANQINAEQGQLDQLTVSENDLYQQTLKLREQKQETYSALTSADSRLSQLRNEARVIEGQLKELLIQEARIRSTRETLQATVAAHTQVLQEAREPLTSLEGKLQEATKLKDHWSYWKEVTPRLRAAAVGEILDYLNHRMAYYMDVFSGGSIGVRLYQVTHGKGSRIKVELRTPSGKYGTASGGEKRRVDLGLYMAIADLLKQSAGVSCDLLVCDEITDSLSPQGIASFLGLLKARADEGMSVYVITHNPAVLSSTSFDSCKNVVKQGGVAKLS